MRAVHLLVIAYAWSVCLLPARPVQAQPCTDGPSGPDQANYLGRCRPPAVTAEVRQQVVASLPVEGHLTRFTADQVLKLASLASVLRLHGRDGVYVLRVIDVAEAWAGLHGRVVLLLSAPALNLLDAQELQALVAHEIGHEYLAAEYAEARAARDQRRLRSSWRVMRSPALRLPLWGCHLNAWPRHSTRSTGSIG